MEAIVLIILQIVFVARPALKIVEYLTTIHLSVPGSDGYLPSRETAR